MRKMKAEEIEILLAEFGWATLCMVDPDGRPYAVEFSYFLDNGDICGLVHPRGRAAACLVENPAVCVKVCDSDAQCTSYRAASFFGLATFEKVTDPDEIAWAWDSLEKQLRLTNGEYSQYKERYLSSGRSLPLLRIMVNECTGVMSSPRYVIKKEQLAEPASAVD